MLNAIQKILVVDDDAIHRTMLRTLLVGWGYDIYEASNGAEAVDAVKDMPFDLVLMDLRMEEMSGLDALKIIKKVNPAVPVIIMTAYSSVETAIDALKSGAYDYLTKPLDFDELRMKMVQAVEHRDLKEENRMLREVIGEQFDRRNIIGRSSVMLRLLETTSRAAGSDATILISGESGTGKEMIAGAVHFNSPRSKGPFVKLNCAAITESLLESELFGHTKGAFTGALKNREGKFLQADGGTLFLDEVSEMSLAMQAKFLRVLQEKEFSLVGGEKVIKVDVRIIAATNKDLLMEVKEGNFREDLYYRLNVINLPMPPLRERKEDIPLLSEYFLKMFMEKNNKKFKGFCPKAMDKLIKYDWPGNVRELMNTIERGVVLSSTAFLHAYDLPIIPQENLTEVTAAMDMPDDIPLEEVERQAILRTIEAADGNKSEAARRLGITRMTLNKKLKKYGLM